MKINLFSFVKAGLSTLPANILSFDSGNIPWGFYIATIIASAGLADQAMDQRLLFLPVAALSCFRRPSVIQLVNIAIRLFMFGVRFTLSAIKPGK